MQPFYKPTSEILIWEITETEEELLSLLPSQTKYRHEVLQFKSEKRRKEWLAARVLFHNTFQPTDRIEYLPTGRPIVSGKQLNISITHSYPYVALKSSTQIIGIDLEKIDRRASLLVSKFLNEAEISTLKTLNFLQLHVGAVLLWSAKEAAYKALDTPGINIKNGIQIIVTDTIINAYIPSLNLTLPITYHITSDYVLTICTQPQ